jgi:hypothetical protein
MEKHLFMLYEGNSVYFGFVRIMSGASKDRIGRYVAINKETGKAVIVFGYENDYILYPTGAQFSISSLSNEITKADLIYRYYNIAGDLKSIDMRGNRKVRKYSAEHASLISECNLIRGLMSMRFDAEYARIDQQDTNMLLLIDFRDTMLCNELLLDLEERNQHVYVISHEDRRNDISALLKVVAPRFASFIFVVSKNANASDWLKEEFYDLTGRIDTERQHICCAAIDDTDMPAFLTTQHRLFFSQPDLYRTEFSRMLETLCIV